jgi:hypothetical protein
MQVLRATMSTLIPPSFFVSFQKLPREIREKIYFCVLYSKVPRHVCESKQCYFKERQSRELHEDLAFETRYSPQSKADSGISRILNKDDHTDWSAVIYVGRSPCTNDAQLGLLQHIDSIWEAPCYLENIASCLLSLMRFEGYFLDDDEKWMSEDTEKNFGITKELLGWFWSHLVLDLGEFWGMQRSEPQQEKTPTQYVSSKL